VKIICVECGLEFEIQAWLLQSICPRCQRIQPIDPDPIVDLADKDDGQTLLFEDDEE